MKRLIGLLSIFALYSARADVRPHPIVESGIILYSGISTQSLTGSRGYFLTFASEESRGNFRWRVAAEFSYAAGTASLATSTSPYKLYGGVFEPAFSYFVFREGYVQPFLTVSGNLGWNFLQLTTPPTGTEVNTQGLAYGWELSAGADLRDTHADDHIAVRLRCSLWSLSGRVAGLSAFQLNGLKFGLGLVF